jgi:hypothetical protein
MSAEEERHIRTVRYVWMMSIRAFLVVLCGVFLMLRVPWIWLWLPLVLVGMATAPFLGLETGGVSRIDFATPGVLALAVVSSAFTSQAIATAFDRRNGVLRMLATTPLGRSYTFSLPFIRQRRVAVASELAGLPGIGLHRGDVADGAAIPPHAVFANTAPNVTLFAQDYSPTRSVRSNLQWSGAILDNRFRATIDGTYSRNVNQASTVDLNFDPTMRFTLADEDRRAAIEVEALSQLARGHLPQPHAPAIGGRDHPRSVR